MYFPVSRHSTYNYWILITCRHWDWKGKNPAQMSENFSVFTFGEKTKSDSYICVSHSATGVT